MKKEQPHVVDRRQRYSIRKTHIGAAAVLVGTFLALSFLGQGRVFAEEQKEPQVTAEAVHRQEIEQGNEAAVSDVAENVSAFPDAERPAETELSEPVVNEGVTEENQPENVSVANDAPVEETATPVETPAENSENQPRRISKRSLEDNSVAERTVAEVPEAAKNTHYINFAVEGTATASNVESGTSFDASKAIDGIVNREEVTKSNHSRWATDYTTNAQHLTVDLLRERAIEAFAVEWERQNIKGFRVETSQNGQDFTIVKSIRSEEYLPLKSSIVLDAAVNARYARLVVDQFDGGALNWSSVSLYEFQVLGKEKIQNLAYQKPATASDREAASLGADKAVDGNDSSRWASAVSDTPKTLQVDLGTSQTVSSVIIRWERNNATAYKIQTSQDGTTWTDGASFNSRPEHDDIITLASPQEARYVRLMVDSFQHEGNVKGATDPISWGNVSVYELEVYRQPIHVVEKVSLAAIESALEVPAEIDGTIGRWTLPVAPAGVTVAFVGADFEQIIDHDLTVYQPIVDTTVTFNYRLTRGDETFVGPERRILVRGKYQVTEEDNAKLNVLPGIAEWKGHTGVFQVGSTARIVVNPKDRENLNHVVESFKEDYEAITGHQISIVYGTDAKTGDFYFELNDNDRGLKREGYLMTIADTVKVEAQDAVGTFWSTQTLLQVLKQNPSSIDRGIARDYPKFETRGFVLDVARKPFQLSTLKDMIKKLAWYKYNDFHIHLNDNYIQVEEYQNTDKPQGAYSAFRLESDIREGGNKGLNKADLTAKDLFYTKAEFKELISFAKKRGIKIVPEFDAPAHALAFTKVRPDLTMTDHTVRRWVDHLEVSNPDSLEFIKSVWNEYIDGGADSVFADTDTIHIGVDEFEGNNEGFRKFTDDLLKYAISKGKTPRFWGSLTAKAGSTPVQVEGTELNVWNAGWANPKAMYDQGYKLINTIDGDLYIVPAAGYYYDYLNSERLYNHWEVNNFGGTRLPVGDKQVSGAAFAVWNDKIDKQANGILEHDVYRRFDAALPALAAKMWGNRDMGSYADLKKVESAVGDPVNYNPYHRVDSATGVVLDYKFDTETLDDVSGNNYDASNLVNASYEPEGRGYALRLNGGVSHIKTPLTKVGVGNSLTVRVKLDVTATGEQILSESGTSAIKLVQKETGKVGFSTEGYDHSFDYTLPKGEWVELTFVGREGEADLLVNGQLVHTLSRTPRNTSVARSTPSGEANKLASLILPVEYIGSRSHAMQGLIDRFIVRQDVQTSAEQLDSSNWAVTANNEDGGDPIASAFDGNRDTIWHTQWNPSKKELPATITIDMKEAQTIDHMLYVPRQIGRNGNITRYKLSYKLAEADDWTELTAGTFDSSSSDKTVNFGATSARYLKMDILEGVGGFGSAAEFIFGKYDILQPLRDSLVEAKAHNELSSYYTDATAGALLNLTGEAEGALNSDTVNAEDVGRLVAAIRSAIDGLERRQETTFTEPEYSRKDSHLGAITAIAVNETDPRIFDVTYATGQRGKISIHNDHVVRYQIVPQGENFSDSPTLAWPEARPAEIVVKRLSDYARGTVPALRDTDSHYLIDTGAVELRLSKAHSTLEIYDKRRRKVVLSEASPLEMTTAQTKQTLKAGENSQYFGGGTQNGRFTHKGNSINIVNENNWVDGGVASPNPFYWTTDGYGVLRHTFRPGRYDFEQGDEHTVSTVHNDSMFDAYYFVNSKPIDLLKDYYELTGAPQVLPIFSLYEGHLNAYNRDYWVEVPAGTPGAVFFEEVGKYYKEYQPQHLGDREGIRESLNGRPGDANYPFTATAVIDRYKRNDMPLGWILSNDGYGAGYGQTSTLEGNIQNLKEFSEYARQHGVESGLWTQSDLHPKEGVAALLQRDLPNEVREALVRILKTDVAWVGPGYSFGLNGIADAAHIMTTQGNNARPFIITLDGWGGTQRYGGIWSGDQVGGEWEYIRFHIPTYIGTGLSGNPNISSDMDGIFGGGNKVINTRDYQWKTFTGMQLNMDGWGWNPKNPYAFDRTTTDINRSYLKWKSMLVPYSYSIMHEAADGHPIIQAMFLQFPNEAINYTKDVQYQYMYGKNILVAPIYEQVQSDADGNDIRNKIYLPAGEQWIDFFTGEIYEGGQMLNNFNAPIWKLPVFIRNGAIIPVTAANNNYKEIDHTLRQVDFYPHGRTDFTLVEDDGITESYKLGKVAKTLITSVQEGQRVTLTINRTDSHYEGFVREKASQFNVNVSSEPSSIRLLVDGQAVELTRVDSLEAFKAGSNVYYYDARPNLNQFSTEGGAYYGQAITKNPVLRVKSAVMDVTAHTVSLELDGFVMDQKAQSILSREAGQAPVLSANDEANTATTVFLSWQEVEGATSYELEVDGVRYSNISGNRFEHRDLPFASHHGYRIRAVVANSHTTPWSELLESATKENPLVNAIDNIRLHSNQAAQASTPHHHLVDKNVDSQYHSKWDAKSVPELLTLDLQAAYELDKLVYVPRSDGGLNGIITAGEILYSEDGVHWFTAENRTVHWAADATEKTYEFPAGVTARYVRLNVTATAGNSAEAANTFVSGQELFVFKKDGTKARVVGDVTADGTIDSNDITSLINYAGLRRNKDNDFEGYVEVADLNKNNVIDAYDIYYVTSQLGEGDKISGPVGGRLVWSSDRDRVGAGEEFTVSLTGKGLANIEAITAALPIDKELYEVVGQVVVAPDVSTMQNFSTVRTHGDKSIEAFVLLSNRRDNPTIHGDKAIASIRLRAKRATDVVLTFEQALLTGSNRVSESSPILHESQNPEPDTPEVLENRIPASELVVTGNDGVYQVGNGLSNLNDDNPNSLTELKWDWEPNHVDGRLPADITLPQDITFKRQDGASFYLTSLEIDKRTPGNGTVTKYKVTTYLGDEQVHESDVLETPFDEGTARHELAALAKVDRVVVTILEARTRPSDVNNKMMTLRDIRLFALDESQVPDDEPAVPSEPSTPSDPTVPSEPSTPSGPTVPSEPSTPSNPTVPSEPSTPSPTPDPAPTDMRILRDSATGLSIIAKATILEGVERLIVRRTDSQVLNDREYDAFDVLLIDKDGKEQQPRGAVLVRVPARREVEALYHINTDNQLENMPFTQTGNTVEFTTNHFSVYALVYHQADRLDKDKIAGISHGQTGSTSLTGQSGQTSMSVQNEPDVAVRQTPAQTDSSRKVLPATGDSSSSTIFLLGLQIALLTLFSSYKKREE
ncbi:hypothetical protein BVE84_04785 [Streptococcus azizii]|uniref:Beta-N-acetylhexosaminidase n=1 Tax=Streptococcus azizii TaxID=1579424 RepID=A0AB36JRL1_9STRE|nr:MULTISPECIES: discoidin domain-containing protein [Streptococcus]MBF0776735.1 discoidin domain-containing protein [Streptococcus sp. 19428wD3_AN2]ONK27538.1 hypothetical protein BVE85_06350 [Streptococcus azizii]ONK27659.1 hypothetical protein BVE86_04625 [Streptococcus azizii]ONK29839.1 hypothetical protein BVE84_04785 [Streptococcus azizii]TFU82472.1 DUF5110 domain-containing protein [Streptococcus sp. AN2]